MHERHQLPAGGVHRPHREARNWKPSASRSPISPTPCAEQTGISDPYEDWFPLSCVTPFSQAAQRAARRGDHHAELPSALLARHLPVRGPEPQGRAGDAVRGYRPDAAGDGRAVAQGRQAASEVLHEGRRPGTACASSSTRRSRPEGLTFNKFLQTLQGMTDKKLRPRRHGAERLHLPHPDGGRHALHGFATTTTWSA